jgi:hypothetical protein
MVCKIFPLAANFCFESVPLGRTPISRVETPLPLFAVGTIAIEYVDHFLAEVEKETEKVLGSFGPREYDALRLANIPNGGLLNCVFEQMGVSYSPRPEPGSAASQSANGKRKAEVVKSWPLKRSRLVWARLLRSESPPPKVGPTKTVGVLKILVRRLDLCREVRLR